MRLGVRRRVSIALVVTGVLGTLGKWIFDAGHRAFGCSSTSVRALHLCTSYSGYRSWARWVIAGLLVLVAVGAVLALARWALAPVRGFASTVSRLGPQNLGERVPVTGTSDEADGLAAELNLMMDRLAAGYEGQRNFAANASHELRTPLAVQRTLIEVGMSGPLTPDQLQLLARQLLETNERNERLIEGLLVLSESERGVIGPLPLRLDHVAQAAADMYADKAHEADVSMRLDVHPTTVLGEAALLERLVANLVENAIKYNHVGGCVDVAVNSGGVLRVVNSGPDVPAAVIPTLFEPFRRMTGSRIDHSGGAGLGLAIARSIAKAHGGTVTATAGERGGLVVEVAFPAVPA